MQFKARFNTILKMAQNHEGHSHNHAPEITSLNTAFIVGIILNLGYVFIQVFIGLSVKSLSLLSDAGHNFLDVAGLALAMLAFKLSKSKSTGKFTYGYKKASILVSLLNAVLLLISIGAIGYEAIFRFQHPEPIPGKIIAIVSAIGIFINGISAFMFFRDKDRDMNVKSAFLHLAADALVSLALVVGGIIIFYTGFYWIDPLLSLVVCAVIIASTWSLLRDSLHLSLDGVPRGIDIEKIKTEIMSISGVGDFHHVHVWAMSTTENALTAHVFIKDTTEKAEVEKIKTNIKLELEHFNIRHSTIEVDFTAHHDDCANHDEHDDDAHKGHNH